MKVKKDYIGFRTTSGRTSIDGMTRHQVDIYLISHSNYNGKQYSHDDRLFSICFYSSIHDSEYNKGQHFTHGYSIEELDIDSYHHDLIFKLVAKFNGVRNLSTLFKALRNIKACKMIYSSDPQYRLFPGIYRNHKELYFSALENGMELKRAA